MIFKQGKLDVKKVFVCIIKNLGMV